MFMRDHLLNIGIVGCGAIGSSLAEFIVRDMRKEARLSAVFDLDAAKSFQLARKIAASGILAAGSAEALIKRSDLVVEAASAHAAWPLARHALAQGRDVMIMSAGGVIGHLPDIGRLSKRNNARVYIPSGALCGIDALKAAMTGRIRSVTLTTRKHPRSFAGVDFVLRKGIDVKLIRKDTVLFSGPAQEAVRHFPQNINVAAILSMAGVGAQRTKVVIVASPKAARNVHEVRIESDAGSVSAITGNIVHPDNPKTSYLAVLSACAVLKGIVSPVRIGT